ncbi:MAG: hypothetical protein PQJ46_06955 [Spirochaetales bacterium]|nr:hypothetical protein [Spirochaetales bacterium]
MKKAFTNFKVLSVVMKSWQAIAVNGPLEEKIKKKQTKYHS